jgi:hypothetical protein
VAARGAAQQAAMPVIDLMRADAREARFADEVIE